MKIRKAVIPVAGFGTRFLPITKSVPKEMLPIVDRPIIQIVVEGLIEAGIEDIIFIVSPYKRAIEDYFNPHFELESLLEKNNKGKELEEIQRLFNLANFVFIRQKSMSGNGDAILTAQPAVGNEPFLVFWGDEFIKAEPGFAQQLLNTFNKYQSCILGAVKTENPQDGGKYAFATGEMVEDGVMKIDQLIEKPGVGKAPSNLATVSGFAYTPEIFEALSKAKENVPEGKELVYVDGLNILKQTQPIYAMEAKNAHYFDTGNKLEYLKTVVEFAIKDEQLGEKFKEYLKNLKLE